MRKKWKINQLQVAMSLILLSLYPQQVIPILEILYHVEDRNSHHVYMALIILLILTEDDTFNRSIHEVVSAHTHTPRFNCPICSTSKSSLFSKHFIT